MVPVMVEEKYDGFTNVIGFDRFSISVQFKIRTFVENSIRSGPSAL